MNRLLRAMLKSLPVPLCPKCRDPVGLAHAQVVKDGQTYHRGCSKKEETHGSQG